MKGVRHMLKNDMRKCMIQGKTFEEFLEKYGPDYEKDFPMEIMRRCWKNTKDLIPEEAWLKYLKNSAAAQVRYLTMVCEALKEQGVNLREIRAGYMLNDLLKKQIYYLLT